MINKETNFDSKRINVEFAEEILKIDSSLFSL